MDRGRLGLALVAVAVLGLLVVFGVSAATAPSRTVTGTNETATLVGVQGGGVGWHEHGRVKRFDRQGDVVWEVANADSYFDVTRTANGTVLAGFMHSGYSECGPYESPCARTGFRILAPNASEPTVFEYSFPVRTQKNSEVHDVERLSTGEYLLSDMDRERIFTVAPNGTVTWEWRASSFYRPPEDPTRRDWLHLNDVDVIGEGRYLVSIRNANQILVVERGAGVVEVINRDDDPSNDGACQRYGTQLVGDDPRCGDPEVLDHQHNPQWLGDGAVLVADSDNNRVVELHRTESGEWEVAWTLRSANGIALTWPRDADRLENGNTLVTDTINRRILEVNRSGEVVWSTTTEFIPYEADRLPEGETTSAAVYDGDGGGGDGGDGTPAGDGTGGTGSVPVLTTGLSILQSVVALPFWVSEWHLLAVLLALVFAGAGVTMWWRDRESAADGGLDAI